MAHFGVLMAFFQFWHLLPPSPSFPTGQLARASAIHWSWLELSRAPLGIDVFCTNRLAINQLRGNQLHGNQLHGNQARGNQVRGTQVRGMQLFSNPIDGGPIDGS
jgi:hypothetical protein